MTAWDIAVIGGGVAGSTAAALLAQQGLRVILMEKGGFPRQKVCGEFLSPEGAHVLQRLGAWPRVEAHQPPRIQGFALTAGRRETRHRLPSPGWGVSRWVLDQVLWEFAAHSGVSTRAHCAVEQVTGDYQRGFSLTVRQAGRSPASFPARAILCAAGQHWRSRGRPRTVQGSRRSHFVGVKAHFRGIPLDRHVELHTIQHGYCGMVEVIGGVTNVCCWVRAEALRRGGGRPHQFLASALEANPCLGLRMAKAQRVDTGWTTTSASTARTASPVADAMWNIGDRAAMIAPLTGDGMGMGLRTAELAATTLLAVFRQELPWAGATAAYAHRWRQEFLPRLRWGRALEVVLLQPRLASLACVALRLIPSLMVQSYQRTRQPSPGTGSTREAS
jgi:flavin-dependent dehydrogenase